MCDGINDFGAFSSMEMGPAIHIKEEQDLDYDGSVCRLCDKVSHQTYDIFHRTDGGKQIIQLIKEVLPIVIYRNDPLSKQICDLCYENLETSYQLKNTALETLSMQKLRLRNQLYTQDVEIYLQTVENREIRLNGGIPDSRDAQTSTETRETQENNDTSNLKTQKPPNPEPGFQFKTIQINGNYSHLNGNKTPEPNEMEKENRKRFLEESPLIQPNIKRRKIGPKSQTNSRNIIECVKYEPLTLMQISLNTINKENLGEFDGLCYQKVTEYKTEPICLHCNQIFDNVKELSMHEAKEHIKINLFDKVDNEVLWNVNRDFARLRNSWYLSADLEATIGSTESIGGNLELDNGGNFEKDNGENFEIDKGESFEMENAELDITGYSNDENSQELPPIIENGSLPSVENEEDDNEGIVLYNCKPYIKGIPLANIDKEDRRKLYRNIIVSGIKRKFCPLCRFTFKDNWAIELHYFSSACFYTCRYCGCRFNKQRQLFEDHVDEHINLKHRKATKVFAARKKNDPIPKIISESEISYIQEDEERRIEPLKMKALLENARNKSNAYENCPTTRELMNCTKNANSPSKNVKIPNKNPSYTSKNVNPPIKHPNYFGKNAKFLSKNPNYLASNKKTVEVKQEVDDSNKIEKSQAYFCRKCYKVYFKVTDFNEHVKNCQNTKQNDDSSNATNKTTTAYSSSGRPIRNCVKEVSSYSDNLEIDVAMETEPYSPSNSNNSYYCNLCNSMFPSVQSRNSHMRIHKANMMQTSPVPTPLGKKRNLPNTQKHSNSYQNVYVKPEPIDMEPEVQIHETDVGNNLKLHTNLNNVNISLIPKSNKSKPLNPDIMRLVQNNPSITIRSMSDSNSSRSNKVENSPVNLNKTAPSSSYSQQSLNNSINSNPNLNLSAEDPGKMYRCSSCSKPFSNKSNLYFHKKNQCGGSRYPCPFCKKRFGTESAYSSHIYYSHPE